MTHRKAARSGLDVHARNAAEAIVSCGTAVTGRRWRGEHAIGAITHNLGCGRERSAISPASDTITEADRLDLIAFLGGARRAGTTTVVTLLARALTDIGQRVAVLDASRGRHGRSLEMPASPVLGDVFDGRCTLGEALSVAEDTPAAAGQRGMSGLSPCTSDARLRLRSRLDELSRNTDLLLIDAGAARTGDAVFLARTAQRLVMVTTPEPQALFETSLTLTALLRNRPTALVDVLVNRASVHADGRRSFGTIVRLLGLRLSVGIGYGGELPDGLSVKSGGGMMSAAAVASICAVAAQLVNRPTTGSGAAIP